MSLLKWFDGNSKEMIQQMEERNCVVLIYIGKGDEDLMEVFNDSNIIQLLNNELILCFKMNPDSESFQNFKEIFNDAVASSIYLLEKNNSQQHIIKMPDFKEFHEIQLDLKRQLLKAIHSITKVILDAINVDENKQKYIQYSTLITNKLQEFDNNHVSHIPKTIEEVKKSNDSAKIKIKIPCKEVTLVHEFQSTSSLDDVKTFVLKNVDLPKGTMKYIAHRQFFHEDFCQSLETLELCPSSTIYVHLVPLAESGLSTNNLQSWLRSIFHFSITVPYNFLRFYITSLFHTENPSITKPAKKFKSNIHQLRNDKSDDDENNTYNGNSTQQM